MRVFNTGLSTAAVKVANCIICPGAIPDEDVKWFHTNFQGDSLHREPKLVGEVYARQSQIHQAEVWSVRQYQRIAMSSDKEKKPKTTKISKFLVQGGNQVVKQLFVFDELPAIYKSVCAQTPSCGNSLLLLSRRDCSLLLAISIVLDSTIWNNSTRKQ